MLDNHETNPDKSHYPDQIDNFERFLIPDLEQTTKGTITQEQFVKAKKILDVGCGQGALGQALKKLNYTGELTGVDLEEYDEFLYENAYREVLKGDINEPKILDQITEKGPFDFVVAYGLPWVAFKTLVENRTQLPLVENGTLVMVGDWKNYPNLPPDIASFKGNYASDNLILVWKKTT